MGDQKPAQVVGLLLGFSYCSSREGSLFPCLALQNLSWTHAKSRTSDPADRKTISLTVDRQMPTILVVFACVCIFSSQAFGTKELYNQEASQGSLSVASSSSSAPALHSKRLNGDTLGPPESKGIEMSRTWFFYTFWRFLLISELLIQFHQCLQFRYIRYHFIVWLWPLDWLRLWNLAACNCILTKKEPRRSSFRPRPVNWMGNFD